MFIHSIRWRLLLWFGFLLTALLAGFGATAYHLQRVNRFNQIDQDLEKRLGSISVDVRVGPASRSSLGLGPRGREPGSHDGEPPPDWGHRPLPSDDRPGPGGPPHFDGRTIRLSSRTLEMLSDTNADSYYYAAWARSGSLLSSSSNLPADIRLPPRVGRETTPHTRTRESFREAFHYTEMGECILVGRSISSDLAALRATALWLGAIGTGILLAGLGGATALANQALKPIDRISAAAHRISGGNLAERIETGSNSELGRLAEVLNDTFGRLETAFKQQKQFTADASHELRTPIAVIIAEAQTTLARPRTASEYEETIETCLDAAQEMRRLTESLLQLARLDAAQEIMESAPLPLADLVQDCVEMVQPLAKKLSIGIVADLQPVEVDGDRTRLRQVVINVLSNATHYNKPEGSIKVSLSAEGGFARLMVIDTGRGIATEDLPHIFERFYRGDKSRSNPEGRSGLGLAISKAIVEAHRGTIEATSEWGTGTTMVIKLPIYEPRPAKKKMVVGEGFEPS